VRIYYSNLDNLLGCGARQTLPPSEVVFKQGDAADCFYFVDRGRVIVSVEGQAKTEIGAGDFFGETALMRGELRNATISAGAQGADLIRFSKGR
jgi:CRP-like cAMP-binding protein